jgi:hypothetical protein
MRHYNPRLGGIEAFMVHVEDALGPWDWTNVVFCGPQGCREVAKGIAGANGVLKVGDKLCEFHERPSAILLLIFSSF